VHRAVRHDVEPQRGTARPVPDSGRRRDGRDCHLVAGACGDARCRLSTSQHGGYSVAVSFWDLLQRRVSTDGARPLLTCYDADGGRTELSAITYANWVAKGANLILDEIDADAGDRIAVPLLECHPGHWMGLVWAG